MTEFEEGKRGGGGIIEEKKEGKKKLSKIGRGEGEVKKRKTKLIPSLNHSFSACEISAFTESRSFFWTFWV